MRAIARTVKAIHGIEISLIPDPDSPKETKDIDTFVSDIQKVGALLVNSPSGHVIEVNEVLIDTPIVP